MTKLGRTGLEVSRMGLGLAALGRPGYINLGHSRDLDGKLDATQMERRCHAVLDAAWEAGVRYFDAARSYGRAEEFLQSWLPGHKAAVVASKWGYRYTAGWRVETEAHELKDHSLRAFEWQLEESRLRLPLALYQVHSVTADSPALDDTRLLRALMELRRSGVHVGLTLSGVSQAVVLGRALALRVDGEPLFETVQATWNLHERSCEDALKEAHAAGLGVILKEGLANGRLARAEGGERLRARAESLGVGSDALALAAVLAQPFCHVALSGAATEAQMRSNLRALTIDGAWVVEEFADLVEDPAVYWATRAALPWN
jgi:aryl-alcohol dehydrogenase-like predicted oxidoreductase